MTRNLGAVHGLEQTIEVADNVRNHPRFALHSIESFRDTVRGLSDPMSSEYCAVAGLDVGLFDGGAKPRLLSKSQPRATLQTSRR